MKAFLCATALTMSATLATAAPTNWTLTYGDGTPLGTLAIDFATGTATGAPSGQYGTYSIPAFVSLNTPDQVGSTPVFDFLKFLDPATGTNFFVDYGGGESYSFTLNEAAIEIGTLTGPLSPLGGTFEVIIHELFNFDETFTTCSAYEVLYDPDTGEYLGQGPCLYTSSYSNYNIGSDDFYTGFLSYTPPVAAVPLPAGGLLLAAGLGALAFARRRRT